MDWSEQTNQLMKTWTDAQRQLLGGWMDWAQAASGGAGATPAMFDPNSALPDGGRYLVGRQGFAGAATGGQYLWHAGHDDALDEPDHEGMAGRGAED